MANKTFGAILSLKDNVSGTLKGIKQEQIAFKKEIQKTQEQINKKTEMRVNNSSALKAIKETGSALRKSKLGKSVTTVLAYKDRATAGIKKVTSGLKNITSKPFKAIITAKDKTSGVINGIKDKLLNLKTLAGGLAIGAAAKLGFDNIIKPGAELEGYKTSMTHWMKGDEKGADAYLGKLRKEADLTPFGTDEVIQAGSRAIGITSGDTKSAMDMVKLSEDMASLTPGKSVMDAMEAIADAQMGEMERLTISLAA